MWQILLNVMDYLFNFWGLCRQFSCFRLLAYVAICDSDTNCEHVFTFICYSVIILEEDRYY